MEESQSNTPIPPPIPTPPKSKIVLFPWIFLLLLLGTLGFLIYQNMNLMKKISDLQSIRSTTPIPTLSPNPVEEWSEYSIEGLGLSYRAPSNLTVKLEEANPGTYALYIENGSTNFDCSDANETCYYQLYLISQGDITYNSNDFEAMKVDLDPTSVVDTQIGGYPAFQGQVAGERNRYVTYILKGDRLISIFTAQPVEINRLLTEQILSTFVFTN